MAKNQVIMKTGTFKEWAMCEDKYIPAPCTLIVYQDEGEMPKIKFSDGIHKLKELPFININNSERANSSVTEDELLNL